MYENKLKNYFSHRKIIWPGINLANPEGLTQQEKNARLLKNIEKNKKNLTLSVTATKISRQFFKTLKNMFSPSRTNLPPLQVGVYRLLFNNLDTPVVSSRRI